MSAPTTVELTDPQLVADPYAGYDAIREAGPLRRSHTLNGGAAWLVTRQDDVRAVLTDPRIVNDPANVPGGVDDMRARMFASIGIPPELLGYLADSAINSDGEAHARVRRLVSRAFTVRRVAQLRPRVEEITAELLDGLPVEVDLLERFAYPLPITVICELVGVPETSRPDWRRWGAALVSMDPGRIPTAMSEMVAHCHDLVDRRRAQPQDDLLSGLIAAVDEDGDRLSDVEIVTMLLSLVLTGHETTAHLIANSALMLMTTGRDQLATLQRDPSLWPAAVGELVRTQSAVHIAGFRYAATDLEIGGTAVHAGEALIPVLVSANRDPRTYSDPTVVDVTRLPVGRGDGHVGFGHGPHYCLGAALARQEAEVALKALVDRYPDVQFAGDEPQWRPLPGTRRLAGLPVRLE